MDEVLTRRVAVALVHYPCRDRNGAEIAASVDWVDFFDAGRVTLVYGVAPLYVVQPVEAQKALVQRLITHGSREDREAEKRGRFDHGVITDSLEEAIGDATARFGERPLIVATTARGGENRISFELLRARIAGGQATMILFGKASGLADSVLDAADACLEPISGGTGFDHLPVRGAFAIALDRLMGAR